MPPDVSIIIPIYNAEQYIASCLGSIVGQTLQDLEILCIDDGSSDHTPEILSEWQHKDSRITILQGTHEGPSKARNLGISEARGEYIAFVDSDDTIDPDMMKAMFQAARENGSDMVVCGLALEFESPSHFNQGAVNWGKARYEGSEKACAEIAGRLRTNVLDKLIRRELINRHQIRFPEELTLNEDGVFVWSCLAYCQTISFLGKNYYHYLQRADSAIARIYAKQGDSVLQLIPSWARMESALHTADQLEEYFTPFLNLVCGHIKHFGQYIPESCQGEWNAGTRAYLQHIAEEHRELLRHYQSTYKKQYRVLYPASGSCLQRFFRSLFR